MEGMFREACNERIKIAEELVLNWMAINWDAIESMFLEIPSQNVVIVTRSTLKTHEQYLSKHFEGSKYVVPRLRSYTHHSSDYFPKDTKYPFFVARDADMEKGAIQESSQLASLAGELVNDAFFIVLQTTKKEGRIEKFGPIRWLTLPRMGSTNGSKYEVNCVAEIAALWLFGETRYQGFLSMLWLDFRYDVIQNIQNHHFAHMIQESLISPFYLSPTISKHAIFMGFRYETYKSQSNKRKMSPVRKKPSSKNKLKSKPRITRPPSPLRETKDSLQRSDLRSLEFSEDLVEEELGTKDSLELRSEDPLEETPIVPPPSPKRAKLPSPAPKRRKAPIKKIKTKKKEKKKITKKSRKRSDTQIINPRTGRPITVGGKVYRGLVEQGIISEK